MVEHFRKLGEYEKGLVEALAKYKFFRPDEISIFQNFNRNKLEISRACFALLNQGYLAHTSANKNSCI